MMRGVTVWLLPPVGEGWDGGEPRSDMAWMAPTPTLPQRGREKGVR